MRLFQIISDRCKKLVTNKRSDSGGEVMRIRYIPTLILTIIIICTSSTFAQKIIVVTEEFPPYNYINQATGDITGLSVDIIRALFSQVGEPLEIKVYPWARAHQMAQNQKNVMIFSIKRTDKRENLFKWVGELAAHKAQFITLKSNDSHDDLTLEELRSQVISVIRGGAIATALASDGFTKLDLCTSRDANWTKLKRGRTSLWCTNLLSARHTIKTQGDNPGLIKVIHTHEQLSTKYLYVAFSSQTENATVEKFKQAFKIIKENGAYAAIYRKYGITP